MSQLIKFSSQADAETLKNIKQIARQKGRQLQLVLDEAISISPPWLSMQ